MASGSCCFDLGNCLCKQLCACAPTIAMQGDSSQSRAPILICSGGSNIKSAVFIIFRQSLQVVVCHTQFHDVLLRNTAICCFCL